MKKYLKSFDREVPADLKPNVFDLQNQKLIRCRWCERDQFLRIHLGILAKISWVECSCGVRGPRMIGRKEAVKAWQEMNKDARL